jgi:hypothetical protein
MNILDEHEQAMEKRRHELILSYPYPTLMEKHLDGARLLSTREAMLTALPGNGIVAEIGVASGDFSHQILQLNKPQKLHLIDCWDSERYGTLQKSVYQRFEKEIDSGLVEINLGLSTEVLPSFEDGYFDWVYIDTVHDYKTTAQELLIARHKVKKGGVIAGHDYCQGNMISGWSYGVIQAVHEFCVNENWRIKFLTSESHCYLSFAITEI